MDFRWNSINLGLLEGFTRLPIPLDVHLRFVELDLAFQMMSKVCNNAVATVTGRILSFSIDGEHETAA
jgi:hypothetical protein